MGYYGRRYMRTRRIPGNPNPEIIKRIEKTAGRGITVLTDWERKFLASLLEAAKKWGRLTAKQHNAFQRIEKKTDPETQKARNAWDIGFTPEMREKAVFAANYYIANPPWFADAARRILSDENFVPSEKLYRKMVENKYVERALTNSQSQPLYEIGSMVTVRDSINIDPVLSKLRGKDVLVLSVEQDVTSSVKGGRRYTVLPIGAPTPIQTQERWLKRKR